MKYVLAFAANRREPRVLEEGATRASVSAECRRAALAFVTGSASGWSKRELALWLTGPYADATRHCAHGERTAVVVDKTVQVGAVEALVATTRRRWVSALEDAAQSDGALEFAETAIDQGFVQRAVDVQRFEVWVPADRPRMRLEERVGALFAADYLNDPVAYGALRVCHLCEVVAFDEDGPTPCGCARPRHVSGIVTMGGTDAEAEDVPRAPAAQER